MAMTPTDLKSLARSHTEAAINVLAGVMRQRNAPPSARVAAASCLLDRGWGKPMQTHGGEDGGDIRIVIRQLFETVEEKPMKVIEHEADEDQLALPLGQPNGR